MDVIIPYKKDIHEGIELKYSLRSIEKYFPYNRIIIIGDLPNWCKCDWIPWPDYPDRKEYSIKEKIRKVCGIEISENFAYFNDDHFILQPLAEIKYWYNYSLKEELTKARSAYKSAVERTLKQFPEGKNFDIHVPIIFNKEKFKEIMTYEDERCLKSTYCNSLGIEGEYLEDLKINRVMNEEEIKERIKGKPFFSTGPIAVDYNLTEVLQEIYPLKGTFEK